SGLPHLLVDARAVLQIIDQRTLEPHRANLSIDVLEGQEPWPGLGLEDARRDRQQPVTWPQQSVEHEAAVPHAHGERPRALSVLADEAIELRLIERRLFRGGREVEETRDSRAALAPFALARINDQGRHPGLADDRLANGVVLAPVLEQPVDAGNAAVPGELQSFVVARVGQPPRQSSPAEKQTHPADWVRLREVDQRWVGAPHGLDGLQDESLDEATVEVAVQHQEHRPLKPGALEDADRPRGLHPLRETRPAREPRREVVLPR